MPKMKRATCWKAATTNYAVLILSGWCKSYPNFSAVKALQQTAVSANLIFVNTVTVQEMEYVSFDLRPSLSFRQSGVGHKIISSHPLLNS